MPLDDDVHALTWIINANFQVEVISDMNLVARSIKSADEIVRFAVWIEVFHFEKLRPEMLEIRVGNIDVFHLWLDGDQSLGGHIGLTKMELIGL